MSPESLPFALTDAEAEDRFKIYGSQDPFPDIAPALLNSADIYDYVRVTGMVWPFDQSPEKLKSASYEVEFLGEVIDWDVRGEQQTETIKNGVPLKFKKNSIAFVFLKTKIRLPDYIALRFNLKITHVHRGLLLGTGPLIDPGFVGRLLIPLHNLTSEDYFITGGKGFIWVEFTKLSQNQKWDSTSNRPEEHYHAFPHCKRDLNPWDYFLKASNGKAISSSIPGEIRTTKESAEQSEAHAKQARDDAEAAKAVAKNIGIGLTVGGLISFAALVVALSFGLSQVVNLVSTSNEYVRNARNNLSEFRNNSSQLKIKQLGETIKSLKNEVQVLKTRLEKMEKVEATPNIPSTSQQIRGKTHAKPTR